jgi:hypothetical protein
LTQFAFTAFKKVLISIIFKPPFFTLSFYVLRLIFSGLPSQRNKNIALIISFILLFDGFSKTTV